MNAIDLHRLEIFCKVGELKSFTQAAEVMLLSQPTVSEHIRSLEAAVGTRLVERRGREVRLTPAGELLYRYAVRLLQLREEALQALAELLGQLRGHLVVGASTIPGSYLLPQLIGAFKRDHPEIQVSVKIANTLGIGDAVLRGDLELGLVGFRWSEPRLRFAEIYLDTLVLVVYPGHPFASRQEVTLAELADQPFVVREPGSGTQMVVQRVLADHGLPFSRIKVAAQMPNTEAVRQSIKAGIGIGILSQLAVAADIHYGTLAAVAIRDVVLQRPIYLIQHQNRELSPLLQAFARFCQEYLATLPPAGLAVGSKVDP